MHCCCFQTIHKDVGSWDEPEVKRDSSQGPQATHCSSADLQPARWRGGSRMALTLCPQLPLLPPPLSFSSTCDFTPLFLAGTIPGSFSLLRPGQLRVSIQPPHHLELMRPQNLLLQCCECPHCPKMLLHSAVGVRSFHWRISLENLSSGCEWWILFEDLTGGTLW